MKDKYEFTRQKMLSSSNTVERMAKTSKKTQDKVLNEMVERAEA